MITKEEAKRFVANVKFSDPIVDEIRDTAKECFFILEAEMPRKNYEGKNAIHRIRMEWWGMELQPKKIYYQWVECSFLYEKLREGTFEFPFAILYDDEKREQFFEKLKKQRQDREAKKAKAIRKADLEKLKKLMKNYPEVTENVQDIENKIMGKEQIATQGSSDV